MTNKKKLGTWQPDPNQGECGTNLVSSSIVGGKEAKPGEFPYMALLGFRNTAAKNDIIYVCGGSVINEWYILTASHCIAQRNGALKTNLV